LPLLSPIDSASPENSLSIREDPTQYNPNLSEEEPLFSARTCNRGSPSAMRFQQVSGQVAVFEHFLAGFADIALVAFHRRQEMRSDPVLIAEW
jgi:hypothetical protein